MRRDTEVDTKCCSQELRNKIFFHCLYTVSYITGVSSMINKKSLVFFLVLSIFGVMGTLIFTSNAASLSDVVSQINVGFLILCLIGVPILDWLVAGLRMWLFTSAICPSVPYLACVRNCAIGSFMCSVTPSQTGGGIAQIWVLTQEGAKAGQAITVLLMTFLTSLMFYLVAAAFLWLASDHIIFPTTINSSVFASAVTVFALVAGGLLLALLYPSYVIKLIGFYSNKLNEESAFKKYSLKFAGWLKDSSIASQMIIKKHKTRFFLAILLSIVIFCNKFFAAYLAARALGIDVSLEQVLIIQMFLNIILYFLPTPGGSGGAEIGSAMLMASIIPGSLLAAHTIIWRSALAYLAVVVGGLFFVWYLHRATKKAEQNTGLQVQ